MRILLVEPERPPRVAEIDGTLNSMQALVGGTIQVIYPFVEAIALVCNEDGKLLNLPLNRALRDPSTGEIYDVVAGTFFLCGAPANAEDFASLTDEQVSACTARFRSPEQFLRLNGHLLTLPMEDSHA